MFLKEEAAKEEMLELLERLYRKMRDDIKLSRTALVSFEYTDDDEHSLIGTSIRPLEETSYANKEIFFGWREVKDDV